MRVTQYIKYTTYMNDIMRRQENIYAQHKMLSTGKKVNLPSDDPVKAGSITTTKSMISDMEQYDRNIDYSLSYLTVAEKTLNSAKNVISNIQELAVTQATGTMSKEQRATAATFVDKRLDELISLGNTMFGDDYIFSGYETDTPAFDSSGNFQGDTNKKDIRIGPNSTLELTVNGGEVFKGTAGGDDIIQSINDFITALNNNDTAAIQSSVDDLEAAFEQLTNAEAEIGAKITRVNTARDILGKTKFDLRTRLSSLEDADIAKVISDLKLGQAALEAAITSAGEVFKVNIFNYL